MSPRLPAKDGGDVDGIKRHFKSIIGEQAIGDLVKKYQAVTNGFDKLFTLRKKYSDDEYQELVERLADKVLQKVIEQYQPSFADAIENVDQEEKKVIEERKKNGDGAAPQFKFNPSAPNVPPKAPPKDEANGEDTKKPELPPKEELEKDYTQYAASFIETNFKGLLNSHSGNFEEMIRVAAERAAEIIEKYDLDPADVKKLTTLAFYDFVVLCDDSWSMQSNLQNEDRRGSLKKILGKIAEAATLIDPTGISLRFLNHDHREVGGWDNLSRVKLIERKLNAVEWEGYTMLGTVLQEKIVQEMVVDRMDNGTFRRPLVVIVITDGDPTNEPIDTFKETIMRCKSSDKIAEYGEAAVVFIVSRVGSDPDAETFLSTLQKSDELRDWVYCSVDRLDDNSPIFERADVAAEAQDDNKYTGRLLQLFLAALDQQTQ
ncbi:hypothetical protein ABW19_dt0205965 [Dactylella cylindrospora]|nr:hypothetical protein ABW19_dt0205965 [Dactylella cylindrospora]